jgi:hypothetical protein
MSNDIERLLFYEREYLRSGDFAAEQNYHMEMRRRLNLALHLWGIVDGLEVRKGPLTPGVPDQFYVSPGMAIDAYGREIVLFAPYAFSEDDLRINRISQAGTFLVWVAYMREPARPPSPGYRVCDLDYQYTRWRESAQILINNTVGKDPATAPGVTAVLSDDPGAYPWPVLLGSVDVALDASNRPYFDHISTSQGQRVYIGLRTQRVKAPATSLSSDTPDSTRPITVEADMQEMQNLIVGQDFSIDPSHIKPPPANPSTFPGPTGNVRVHDNLFLLGDLYKSVGADWLGLKEYIQQLIPEMQFATTTLPTAPSPADPSTGTSTITVTSDTLKKPSKASLFVALSGIKWVSTSDLITWLVNVAGASPVQLVVSAGTPVKKAGTDNQFDVDLSWSIGPKSPAGPGNVPPEMINVESLTVSYITVFYP